MLFCDLVDSTVLATQLDPEELREVVQAYQRVCAEVIQRFEGYIAQYLGDGLLIYFGYPQAHEDDGQRAVRAALGIVEAMERLNQYLVQERGVQLAGRLGIHAGLVVVGEMGAVGRQEPLALGDTPNMAARLQALAAPDTIVISAASYRLIQGFFNCRDGPHTLKGISTPVPVYYVLGESGAQSRLEVASTTGLTPLVGREREVELLLQHWVQATEGRGQAVVLNGEAGIGKSRLVQTLKERLAGESYTLLECRCSAYHRNSPLYPVIDLYQRALQFRREDSPEAKFGKLEKALTQLALSPSELVPPLASLLSLPLEERYLPLTLTAQQQKQKTLEALLAVLMALTAQQPVLFILKDIHWLDPSTLELLGLLVDQAVLGDRGDPARTAGPSLRRSRPGGAGRVLLAAGWRACHRALGQHRGDSSPHQRLGGAQDPAGYHASHPAGIGGADHLGAGADGHQGRRGTGGGAHLRPGISLRTGPWGGVSRLCGLGSGEAWLCGSSVAEEPRHTYPAFRNGLMPLAWRMRSTSRLESISCARRSN